MSSGTIMQIPLLEVAPLTGDRVASFAGERRYLATGGMDVDKIVFTEAVTYDGRPLRADQTVRSGDVHPVRE